jgi:hypothetical protein
MTPGRVRKPAERRAIFAKGKTPAGKPARKRLSALKPGSVLHQTGPHGAHNILLTEDHQAPENRIYQIRSRDGLGGIGILGSELDSVAKWWAGERNRSARTPPEEQPHRSAPLENAYGMGRSDALEQISYVLQHGGTLERGIKAHTEYRDGGDLSTDQHGDDASFHQGAKDFYAQARRRYAEQLKDGSIQPKGSGKQVLWLLATDRGLHFTYGRDLAQARRNLAAKLGIKPDELGWEGP